MALAAGLARPPTGSGYSRFFGMAEAEDMHHS